MAYSVFIDGSSLVTGLQTIIDNLPTAQAFDGRVVNYVTDDEARRLLELSLVAQRTTALNGLLAAERAESREYIELR